MKNSQVDRAQGDIPAVPITAATLILVRESCNVPEVLLLKRNSSSRFMPNAYVFAGGAVDGKDSGEEIYRFCRYLDDAQASSRLALQKDGLQFFVAAIRETFEECGLLLAYDQAGDIVDFSTWRDAELHQIRSRLGARNTDLPALCEQYGWRPATDQLWFYTHWITPPGSYRRFDTRFFIARAPSRQSASLATDEMSELVWQSAANALTLHAEGKLLLMLPTQAVLQEISKFNDVDSLLEFARHRTGITPITPAIPRLTRTRLHRSCG